MWVHTQGLSSGELGFRSNTLNELKQTENMVAVQELMLRKMNCK